MAWLERRGRQFRLVYRHLGRKVQHPLKTEDPGEAEALRLRLEANLRDLHNGRLEAPEGAELTVFLLSDGRVARRAGAGKALTLAELLRRHREACSGRLEANTVRTLGLHAKHLEEVLGGGRAAQSVSHADLQGYVDRRSREAGRVRGRTVSPVTCRKEVATLSAAWHWGERSGLVTGTFPGARLIYPKGAERPPFLTRDEVRARAAGLPPDEGVALWECLFLTAAELPGFLDRVREGATQRWVLPAVATAAYTGARRSEIVRAQVGDFDLAGGTALVRERKRDNTRRTTRRVPLSGPLLAALRPWFAAHPGGTHAFCKDDGSPVPGHLAEYHFRVALAGSEWEVVRGWHTLRHSFASNCAAAGVDQRMIDAWMGHSNPQTAARYRHLIPAREAAEVARVFG